MRQNLYVLEFVYALCLFIEVTTKTQYLEKDHLPHEFEFVYPKILRDAQDVSRSQHRQRRSTVHDLIYINISSVHENFTLKLHRTKNLLAPGFRVWSRHPGNNDDAEDVVTEDLTENYNFTEAVKCLYQGQVISHPDSKASVSLCKGVTGVLMLEDEDYIIEPLPTNLRGLNPGSGDTEGSQAHILYRKSSLPGHRAENYQTRDYDEYFKEDTAGTPEENFHRARRKRSYSTERTVEMLVVVDRAMYRNHGRENVTTYVLSIFNIVSQLYRDRSIGYIINIVLVGLVFLTGNERGLIVTHNADKTLNSFCQWQATVKGRNGKRQHDHAVLLTGVDICSYRDAPCDTLGFAPIEGMCSELRSCIVNEDSGLSTAFTITHELGHNFGMLHDGDGNNCVETKGNIMSPTLSAQSGIFHWSRCSRDYMRKFLNAAQSECLTNQARGTAELKFPDKLPGEIFDADTQCRWQFGRQSKICMFEFGNDLCKNLWCHKGTSMCETKFLPAAEGTSCGNGMWCRQGSCTRYGVRGPKPIDGSWTEWSEWTQCSRSCARGVKSRRRDCNNPRPQFGGRSCSGEISMHKLCNLMDCPGGSHDFRELQCEEHNLRRFRGWYYKWRAHTDRAQHDIDDQCKLYCKAENFNFYYNMAQQVTDGTRCNDFTDNVCVQGKCKPVGCDLVVDSDARNDICGVCRGDNSTCQFVSSTFTTQPRRNTYYPIVAIPKGASNIIIQERVVSPQNYLVLRDVYGKYYLNGKWRLTADGAYRIGGTKFVYKRSYNRPELLKAEGPLREDLVLEILVQAENLGISYSFTIPKRENHIVATPRHNYTWSVTLTDCSQPCAGGEQVRSAHCHRDRGDEVDPRYCDPRQKPTTGVFHCNQKPCKPRWIAEPWSACSRSCGGGKQKRRLYCMQKKTATKDVKVPKTDCDLREKPSHRRECNVQECPPAWYTGPWSECSRSCGKGVKSREVVCRSKTTTGHTLRRPSMCDVQPRPKDRKGCRKGPCPDPHVQWVIAAWSECSSSCGVGSRTRNLRCGKRERKSGKLRTTSEKNCQHLPPPSLSLREECDLKPCEYDLAPDWYTSPWSECSVSCGRGVQTRLVHCIHPRQSQLVSDCDKSSKPVEGKICDAGLCPTPDPLCFDHFSWCHLVPKHNICNHHFYGAKCCLACRDR